MKRRLAWLLFGGVAFWAAATGVAWLVWNETKSGPFVDVLPVIAAAGALCLVPSVLTLVWSAWSSRHSPEQELLAALGGTGVRMFAVLLAGLGLTLLVPHFEQRQRSFWVWVLIFYLFDLALEMTILLRGRQANAVEPLSGGRKPPESAKQ